MRYFRRDWDEDRGDDHADWGTSTWHFATDQDGQVAEQFEVYASGQVLAYDTAHAEDEYGGLSLVALDLDDFAPFEVTESEFRDATASLQPLNR